MYTCANKYKYKYIYIYIFVYVYTPHIEITLKKTLGHQKLHSIRAIFEVFSLSDCDHH